MKVINNKRDNPVPQYKVPLQVCDCAQCGAQLFDALEARLLLLCLTPWRSIIAAYWNRPLLTQVLRELQAKLEEASKYIRRWLL
jgi:hypothetical protein